MKEYAVRMHRGGALTGTEVRGNDRMRKSTPSFRCRRGVALVWTALILFVMLGFVGLSLDWGKACVNVHQLHNGADAAALAGAMVVKWDESGARDRAIALAWDNKAENREITLDRNESNAPKGELVLGRWVMQERTFYPTLLAPNAVKAVGLRADQRADAPRLTLHFGPVFGQDTAPASRYAIAMSVGSSGAGILTLARDPRIYRDYGWTSEDMTELERDGGCNVDLRGVDPETGEPVVGDMQVNGESINYPKVALNLCGNGGETGGKIWAGELNVVGTTDPAPTDEAKWESLYGDNIPFSVNPNMPRMEDPLAALNDTPPDITAMTEYTCPDVKDGSTATISPGWYPNGIDPSGGTIIMEPGMYAVGGGPTSDKNKYTGLVFNGGVLTGEGVTVYVTGDEANGTKYGEVDLGANANVHLVSPGDVSPTDGIGIDGLDGVVLWQDINNHLEASIIGGPSNDLRGTIYMPDNPLLLGGGPNQMGNQVIAGALHIHGNVTLHVAYDGRNMIRAYRSWLVE